MSFPGAAISPDGRDIYVADLSTNSLLVVGRDDAIGAITQLRGRAGCISGPGSHGCVLARGIAGGRVRRGEKKLRPFDVAVSPNGNYLYLLAGSVKSARTAVLSFRRDPATGALEQLPGREASVANHDRRCRAGRAIDDAERMVISPDGSNLYLWSPGSRIAVLSIAGNGNLHQLGGSSGCWAPVALGRSCSALNGDLAAFALSPDGQHAYTARADAEDITV